MRVRSVTWDRLILDERPWLVGAVLVFVILFLVALGLAILPTNSVAAFGMFAGAGLFGGLFAVFVRQVVVIFDRGAGAVAVRAASLFGTTERTVSLSDILCAEVETATPTPSSSQRQRSSVTRRPVLQTAQGTVFLTPVYTGGRSAEGVARAVNDWLSAPKG